MLRLSLTGVIHCKHGFPLTAHAMKEGDTYRVRIFCSIEPSSIQDIRTIDDLAISLWIVVAAFVAKLGVIHCLLVRHMLGRYSPVIHRLKRFAMP